MDSQPAALLRRLNPFCVQALEAAASLCQTRAHAEILPEHWLLKLLEQGEGDLTVLARRYEWDMDMLWQDLLAWLDKLPRSVRQRPQLSDTLQTLMQEAWLIASLNGEEQIRSVHLLMALVDKQKLVRCDGLWPLLTLGHSQLDRLRPLLDGQSEERPERQQAAELAQSYGGEVEFVGRPVGAAIKEGELNPALQNALDKFTLDVTAKAREGKIDPVFGRDTEIRQMVDILSRRRKNNPILVGEPGVGKTALVEGLALRIAEGNVPESLKPVILRTLDLGLLQAGAGVKGEFEQRLKNVIDAVQQSPVPILLFIDEAHTIIGAGNQAGGADAANLLKPALARGELRTIAATTWSEYKQYFERDAALERRFQMVKVDEPDDETACLMLRGLKSRYAEHHNVHITDDAVRASDDEIIGSLRALLPMWRKEYGIKGRKQEAFGLGKILKLADYRILPMMDLLMWAKLKDISLSNTILSRVLYPKLTDEVRGDEQLKDTDRPIAEKAMSGETSKNIESFINKNRHLMDMSVSELRKIS